MKTALIALVAFLCLTSRSDAQEQCKSKVGQQLWIDGMKSFNLGRHAEAVERWEKAYDLCAEPDLLFNLAQAHRKLNNLEKARELFRSYLREAPSVTPAEREDIQKKITELDDLITIQKKSAESPPQGVKGGETGTSEPSPIPAIGKDAVPGGAPGRQATGEPALWYRDWIGWSLVAGGVAVAGLGGGLFVHGTGLHDDAEATLDLDEADRLNESGTSYRTAGGIMLVAGLAVSAVGVVKLAITDSSTSRGRSTSVAVGAGWVVFSGTF